MHASLRPLQSFKPLEMGFLEANLPPFLFDEKTSPIPGTYSKMADGFVHDGLICSVCGQDAESFVKHPVMPALVCEECSLSATKRGEIHCLWCGEDSSTLRANLKECAQDATHRFCEK